MCFLRLRLFIILSKTFFAVHARPEDLFSLDPFASNWNDPWMDENLENLLWVSNDIPSSEDMIVLDDPDFFWDTDNLFGTDSLDLSMLASSCESVGSFTDDTLQARNGPSCPATEPERYNLPTILDDPLRFLDHGLSIPPVGESSPPNEESSQGEDQESSTSTKNEPASFLAPERNEGICDPEKYEGRPIPVCDNPYTSPMLVLGDLVPILLNVIKCSASFPP